MAAEMAEQPQVWRSALDHRNEVADVARCVAAQAALLH